MKTIEERFHELGVVPVVVLEDEKAAVPLAKALVQGGLPCAEVTFRTEAAAESIRLMSEAYPDMLVGAGTVLTTEQVDLAVKSGAKFIVSRRLLSGKEYSGASWMYHSFRSCPGSKKRA